MRFSTSVKIFAKFQTIYCILVILGFTSLFLGTTFSNYLDFDSTYAPLIVFEKIRQLFGALFFLFYLPFGFYLEPFLSGLIFQLLYKSSLKTILLLSVIKLAVGIMVSVANLILFDLNLRGTFYAAGFTFYSFAAGPIVALYFMVVSLITYFIQFLINIFITLIRRIFN